MQTELVRRLLAWTDNSSNFIACQVLADKEQPFALGIRQETVHVRPDLDRVFHPWTLEEVSGCDAMYPRKLESLRLAHASIALDFPSVAWGWVTFPLVTAISSRGYSILALLLAHGVKLQFTAEDVSRARDAW
jgi:hypothetical protein